MNVFTTLVMIMMLANSSQFKLCGSVTVVIVLINPDCLAVCFFIIPQTEEIKIITSCLAAALSLILTSEVNEISHNYIDILI